MASKEKDSAKLKKTLVIAQEISLVKTLCDNEQKVRHRGLHKLGRWLRSRCQGSVELGENDFNRLWKGLFYCLWMADKPLYQEEVVDLISQMVHCFSDIDCAVAFLRSFFKIVGQEWPGIDQLRMDKCMMLVRRMVRQSFVILSKNDWKEDILSKFAACYRTSLDIIPDGLIYHFSDIYVNELSKIGANEINSSVILHLVRPFAEYMSTVSNGRLINHIASAVFLNLIRLSEEGVEHENRFKAWRDRGLPGGTIETIKRIDSNGSVTSDDDDDGDDDNETNDHKVLDPRAGRVDVELPTLNIDPQQFIDMFQLLKTDKLISTKGRKQIGNLINKFKIFLAGRYPLGLQKFETLDNINWKNMMRYTTKELIKFENNDFNGSRTKNLNSSLENSGIWQITPVKDGRASKKKRRISISSNWIVEDNTKCTNKLGSSEKEANLEQNVLNGKCEQDVSNSIDVVHESETESSDSETEVLIKQLKINGKRKRKSPRLNGINELGLKMSNGGIFSKKESETPSTPSCERTGVIGADGTPNVSSSAKKKRVAFLLSKNMIQEEGEYLRLIKNQPVVTFDGEKRPAQPIYKDKGVRSPINPFYKRVGFTSL